MSQITTDHFFMSIMLVIYMSVESLFVMIFFWTVFTPKHVITWRFTHVVYWCWIFQMSFKGKITLEDFPTLSTLETEVYGFYCSRRCLVFIKIVNFFEITNASILFAEIDMVVIRISRIGFIVSLIPSFGGNFIKIFVSDIN